MAWARKSDFSIGLCFRSGCCETLSLIKPGRRADAVRHDDSTIDLIKELSSTMDDAEIVTYLNTNGIFTKTGDELTIPSIRWIRYKHKIPNLYQNNRSGLTVKETALELGISTHKVYYYIQKGIIPASKQRPGWPLEINLTADMILQLKHELQ